MIVLGIDPGTASTGYGIVVKKSGTLKCTDYGVIRTYPKQSPGVRLQKINDQLTEVLIKHKPDALAIEGLYFFKNLKTAIPVSQAKGVVLFAAAKKKVPVKEFSPLQIKSVVAGKGRAKKKEVQAHVKKILKLEKTPRPYHASDALAVALTWFLKEDK
ncbi:MAG: crossover junction endodeoxyribonuclease RuvC [Candidatus Nealsonbacteria bacterium]|nr:crossover junction endodeoxyribonuclease RuvC [Candidatus Nealsonbacteria bacterium]